MIRFVTALGSEALPLVARFGMKSREGAFPWYASDDAALVLSGVGKRAAAAATAYLHAKTGEARDAVWLNVGIAGHGEHEPGHVLLAHTVSDAATGERWYPPRHLPKVLEGVLASAEVISVDRPETRFTAEAAYDMEAAGFYPTALRFSTSELVQVLKVTSDNRKQSFEHLTAERVAALVESALSDIGHLAEHLLALRSMLPEDTAPAELEGFKQRWRFTTSETRKLARLLVRWRALEPTGTRSEARIDARSGPDAIARIEERLARIAREHAV